MENPFSYFSNSLRETVWKIGMDFTLHSHESEKGAKSTLFSPLGAIKNSQSRSLQLFSKQFLEGEFSELLMYSVLGSSLQVALFLYHRLCWLSGSYGVCVTVHHLPP